jgi:hypothetical protein
MAKDHIYAHVYHEGEGKCSGNNISSLVLETTRKKEKNGNSIF